MLENKMDIEWKEEYNLGIEEIDFEHRIFVSIIKKIDDVVNSDTEKSLLRLIMELKKYAAFHFQSEENTMIDVNFPDIINHKNQHERLLSKLQLIILQIEMDQIELNKLPTFLMEWFVSHTLEEDKKLATFLNTLK